MYSFMSSSACVRGSSLIFVGFADLKLIALFYVVCYVTFKTIFCAVFGSFLGRISNPVFLSIGGSI
jgi:hypothetical protein